MDEKRPRYAREIIMTTVKTTKAHTLQWLDGEVVRYRTSDSEVAGSIPTKTT